MKLDDLARFRVDEAAPQAPEPRQSGYSGRILALDQTIAKTGWVCVEAQDGALVRILGQGQIKTEVPEVSHEGTLRRAVICADQYGALIDSFLPMVQGAPFTVVHEMPPVGAWLSRGESSLCAAVALRITMAKYIDVPVVMVAAQHAKKVVTDNGNAKKAEVKAALMRLVPFTATMGRFNQDVADALALAYTFAREG